MRYVVMVGLMRVCGGMSHNSLKDGLRAVAWNTLRKAGSIEKDVRVLEALKMISVTACSFLHFVFLRYWFTIFVSNIVHIAEF